MVNENRDDFTQAVKEKLYKSVCGKCCNCGCSTTGVSDGKKDTQILSIGEAAHICAASPNGPRYDENMSREERISIENGIWLCSNCHKIIDKDETTYTVDKLRTMKNKAEREALRNIGKPQAVVTPPIYPTSLNNIFSGRELKELFFKSLKEYNVLNFLKKNGRTEHIRLDDVVAIDSFTEYIENELYNFRYTCINGESKVSYNNIYKFIEILEKYNFCIALLTFPEGDSFVLEDIHIIQFMLCNMAVRETIDVLIDAIHKKNKIPNDDESIKNFYSVLEMAFGEDFDPDKVYKSYKELFWQEYGDLMDIAGIRP